MLSSGSWDVDVFVLVLVDIQARLGWESVEFVKINSSRAEVQYVVGVL